MRRDAGALVAARGPLPFVAGNKASVGCILPLTGLPHYSFVGRRAAAQLLNLGLDAVAQAIALLRSSQTSAYPTLRAAADGPQALAELYPPMRDVVFSSG